MIVIATHAVFLNEKDIYGPPHAVSIFLNNKKMDHIFIKHRLFGGGKSRIEFYKNGKLTHAEYSGLNFKLPIYFQYLTEAIVTIYTIIKNSKSCKIFIGVDPLNSFAGYILNKLNIVKKNIYFSADFALKRFENPILNKLYLLLDKYAMFNAYSTWSVSKRIIAYRRNNGLPNSKNLLLPNAPFFNDIKRLPINEINNHDIVIVSALEEGIAFELLFDVVKDLRGVYKNIHLIVIGSGSKEEELKKYAKKIKIDKSIIFKGALSHSKMFDVLVKSGIGIALYDNADPLNFRYFSDPMKVRDYFASGLPVIISGNSGINEDVIEEKIGYVVSLNKKEISSKIESILQESKYKNMRKKALAYAEKYDTQKLLNIYLKT